MYKLRIALIENKMLLSYKWDHISGFHKCTSGFLYPGDVLLLTGMDCH